ncbi:MAG: PDZ domain-containing protein [Bacilli bacterium]|nr:PDZ domain-containing protein [Bacilli bacterium]
MKKIIKANFWYFISIIIIYILLNVKLPYYINMPGGTIETNKRIKCSNCNEINGSINLLYVSESEATAQSFLMSYLMPNWDLEPMKEQQINDESMNDIYIRNKLMLEESIDAAIINAYQESNKQIAITNKKNIVLVTTNTNNNLKVGDEILEVDNKEVENIAELKKIINEKKVGDKIKIRLKRNKKEKNVTVKVREENGEKIIGIIVMTDYNYKLDPQIELSFKPGESGASGGLMLALSIYSKISDKDIIKGRKIAGTGTIDSNGNIGEIDGIKYKIMGANKEKIDIVLVPKENYKEAIKIKEKNHYKMKIIKVETFKEAVEYLKK